MSVLSLRLPVSLHEYVRELAEQEGISINQFITLAIAEKMAAIDTRNYREACKARKSRKTAGCVGQSAGCRTRAN